MNTEPDSPIDDILGRLRHTQEADRDQLAPPRWARPAGWILVIAILGVVITAAIVASPL